MSVDKKVLFATYSRAGGPGGVQKSLSQEFRRLGMETEERYRLSSSLREEWPRNTGQLISASVDHFLVRDRKFNNAISLLRTSTRDLLPKNSEFQFAVLGWLPGLLTSSDFSILSDTPTIIRVPDENVFTGVCHYSGGCNGYLSGCHSCPAVKSFAKSRVPLRLKAKIDTYNSLTRLSFVCPSTWIAERAEKSFALRGRQISVIRNPINPVFFGDKNPTPRSSKFSVLYVASQVFDPAKGFDGLAQKLNELAQSKDLNITVVGNHGGQSRRFPHIRFLGRLNAERLSEEYKRAWVTIVPSKSETSGNVVAESFASGTPALVRNVDGLGELAGKVTSDFLFENDYELVEKLMSMKSSSWRQGDQTLRRLAHRHHPSVIAKQYLNLLTSL